MGVSVPLPSYFLVRSGMTSLNIAIHIPHTASALPSRKSDRREVNVLRIATVPVSASKNSREQLKKQNKNKNKKQAIDLCFMYSGFHPPPTPGKAGEPLALDCQRDKWNHRVVSPDHPDKPRPQQIATRLLHAS